jgi:EAL domain-containing protein (putative c-di-GMP-specific phosphodiesterase class I)
VVEEATAQLARWRTVGLDPRVSLNMSARDLHSESIVEHLGDCLRRHRVDPRQLQVEITESALMADPPRARSTLRQVADLGVGISLDDFGTGYSSLQHLRRLPLAEIKVDQSFVATMVGNHDDAAIVASTLDMARALGLRTVAEGVADRLTFQLLGRLGCDLGQGWYLGRPMAADLVSIRYAPATRPRAA